MGLVVLPVLAPEIRSVYDTYFSAFKDDLILDVLFPSGITEEFRAGHAVHTRAYWDSSDTQYTVKCVDSETGDILGMALWDVYLKERPESEWKNPGVTWLEGKQKERAEQILKPLWKKKDDLWGGSRYVYCHVVAVSPDHQRRGAGALLTQWGMKIGEEAGLPVYLESSPVAYLLYKKLGFETIDRIIHKPEVTGEKEDIEVPLMVKLPSSAGDITFKEWRAKRSTVNGTAVNGTAVNRTSAV